MFVIDAFLRHSTFGSFSSLGFQCDVTAAALAVDAQQNLVGRFQILADCNQIIRSSNRLLVDLLDHVALAQTSFSSRRVGIDFCDDGSVDVLRKVQRRTDVVGDIGDCDSTENGGLLRDRKSTRLNSSHQINSYAVFCLKKKKKKK